MSVQFQEYGWLECKQVEACGNDSEHRELKENSSRASPGLQFWLQKMLLLHQSILG